MSTPELVRTPSEEETLSGRGYTLMKKLGEGSYAQVFLAEYTSKDDASKKTILACKVVDTNKAPKDFVRKFLPRELDILVKLNHPHIVHVHSIFQRRTRYYIFMRFAENGDLLDFVLKNGALTEKQARVWLRQLAVGLQYLHQLEIVHRDIKCENVLITVNYNVKLADFGFARYVVDSQSKYVLSETYCGSMSYAAPEIIRGTPYNPKNTDIWSLGVVLYVMLNKAMPFDDSNIRKLYEQQMAKQWKFRAKVAHLLTNQVKKLISCMLEPEAAKRFRIDQVMEADWIAMDPRLLQFTQAEEEAINVAGQEGKEKFFSKREIIVGKKKARIADAFKRHKEEADESKVPGETQTITILRDAGNMEQFKSVAQHLNTSKSDELY